MSEKDNVVFDMDEAVIPVVPEDSSEVTATPTSPTPVQKQSFGAKIKGIIKKDVKKNWSIYLLFIPVFVFFFIFNYIPLAGLLMAFQDYNPFKGLWGSPWVGFDNFKQLFADAQAWNALRNTLVMAGLNLTIGFIIPVFFALLLSQVRWKPFKRVVQSISYMPNFVATVVIVTLLQQFLSDKGAITMIFVKLFGMEKQNLLALNNPTFWFINLFADSWQGCGYGAIVFVAAISSVNNDLYEAASIDGANRIQQMFRITIPCIWPTFVTMFTLKVGLVFKSGFDKVLLLYMPTANLEYSDVLSTYIYRLGLESSGGYGITTALGLFQSIISTILLVFSNWLNKKLTNSSIY